MPRKKQNGFGSFNSSSFKSFAGVNKGSSPGAYGYYPSNRQYGTSVHRTVVEKWNIDSRWQQWRKGFEMFNWTAWSDLKVPNPDYDPGKPEKNDEGVVVNPAYGIADLPSILYQGTGYDLPTVFTGVEFPTMNSDVKTHYVARRKPAPKDLGTVVSVFSDELVYKDQKANRELWVQGTPNPDNARLLLQMIGERLTDGKDAKDGNPEDADYEYETPKRTEATLKNILTAEQRPAVYKGVTAPADVAKSSAVPLAPTKVRVTIPVADIVIPDPPANNSQRTRSNRGLSVKPKNHSDNRPNSIDDFNPGILTNAVIYIPEFFVEKPIADVDTMVWIDGDQYFGVNVKDIQTGVELFALDPGETQLPPSMYDINELDPILTTTNATATISGTYVFEKKPVQRFYKNQYVTADLIADQLEQLSYSVLPFIIKGASIEDINNPAYDETQAESETNPKTIKALVIDSLEFQSEIKVYPPITGGGYLIFTDFSFTQVYNDTNPNRKKDRRLYDPNINPWQDEVFTSGEFLRPAKVYTCSCPAHSRSILFMPEEFEDTTTSGIAGSDSGSFARVQQARRNNRQKRYPLPTVLSQNRFEGIGTTQAAGKMISWQSQDDRLGFNMCKHSIATMFIDGYSVVEPSQYPTAEQRILFDQKLNASIKDAMMAFNGSYKRQGLSLTEIVFALAQGLNLDDVETAYVILNSN